MRTTQHQEQLPHTNETSVNGGYNSAVNSPPLSPSSTTMEPNTTSSRRRNAPVQMATRVKARAFSNDEASSTHKTSNNNNSSNSGIQTSIYQSARMIEAQNHFRQVVKQELQLLLEQGIEREVAVRKLLKRIVQSTLEPDQKDVERVMKQFQMNHEDAVRALIVKQEIGRLKRKGLDAFAAIEMLTRKMQRITTDSDDEVEDDSVTQPVGSCDAGRINSFQATEQAELAKMQLNDANSNGVDAMSEGEANSEEGSCGNDAAAEVIAEAEAEVDVDANDNEAEIENDNDQANEDQEDAGHLESSNDQQTEKQLGDLEAEKKLYLSSLSLCCQRIDNVSISPLPHVTPARSNSSSTDSSPNPMITFRPNVNSSSSAASKRKRRSASASFLEENSAPVPGGSVIDSPFALGPSNKKQKLCKKMEDALVNMITRRAGSNTKNHNGANSHKGHRSISSLGDLNHSSSGDGTSNGNEIEINLSHATKSRKRQRAVVGSSSASSSPPPLLLPVDADEFSNASDMHPVKRQRK